MINNLRKQIGLVLVSILIICIPAQAQVLDYRGHWLEGPLTEWAEMKILESYEDGTLRPDQPITRDEFSKMLGQIFGLQYVEQNQGNGPITREEAAYAIATAYHIQENGEVHFTDAEAISEWAQNAIQSLVKSSYMHGYEDGTFRPKGKLTRAEAIAILDKITYNIISKAGTYVADQSGNVVVNTADVVLKNMTIKGNLYLAEGIGEGDITLDHVQVIGETIIEGGGERSIKLIGTKLDEVIIQKDSGGVGVVVDDDSSITSVKVESAAQLEGKIEKIEINTNDQIELVDAKIETLKTQADAKVILDKNTVIKTLIENDNEKVIEKNEADREDIKDKEEEEDKKDKEKEEKEDKEDKEDTKENADRENEGVYKEKSDGQNEEVSTELVFYVTSDGDPVQGASISAAAKLPGGKTWSDSVKTDSRGVGTLSFEEVIPAKVEIHYWVEKEDWGRDSGIYLIKSKNNNQTIDVSLREAEVIRDDLYTGEIYGMVMLEDEVALGAKVYLYSINKENGSEMVTQRQIYHPGAYHFMGVKPGDYKLEIEYELENEKYKKWVDVFSVKDDMVTKDIMLVESDLQRF